MKKNKFIKSRKEFFVSMRIVILIFAATRMVWLMKQPARNDEPIYNVYMQQINENREANKRMSVQSKIWDRKPPMHYRMWASMINLFEDPLLSSRFLTALIAILWFIFLLKIVFDISKSRKFTTIFAILSIINPFYIRADKTMYAESLVYSIGFWYFYFFYEMCKSFIQKKRKNFTIFTILAFLIGIVLLLTKQSWEIFLLYAIIFIPIVSYQHDKEKLNKLSFRKTITQLNRKKILLLLWISSILFLVIRTSQAQFYPEWTYELKTLAPEMANKTYSTSELMALPFDWRRKSIDTIFTKALKDGYGRYFLIFMGILTISYIIIQYKKKKIPIEFIYTGLVLLFINLPLILILKARETRYFLANTNFAWMILFTILLVFLRDNIFKQFKENKKKALYIAITALIIILGHQGYNAFNHTLWNYDITKAMYTPNKVNQCTKNKNCGRAVPINLEKILTYFDKEQANGEIWAIIIDPQRWHPASYITMYQKRYKNIVIAWYFSPDFITNFQSIYSQIKSQNKNANIYIVYDWLRNRWRPTGNENRSNDYYNTQKCHEKKIRDKAWSTKSNIVICKFK